MDGMSKLRDYCLSRSHPRGRHQARVFASARGMTAADAEELKRAVLSAARQRQATLGVADAFGQRYSVDFDLEHAGQSVSVRSA